MYWSMCVCVDRSPVSSHYYICLLMTRRPPRSTRTDTLFPYTTLFRSGRGDGEGALRVPQSGPIEVSPDALHAAVLSFGRDGSTLTWVNLSDGSVIDLTSLATSGESRGFYISEQLGRAHV